MKNQARTVSLWRNPAMGSGPYLGIYSSPQTVTGALPVN